MPDNRYSEHCLPLLSLHKLSRTLLRARLVCLVVAALSAVGPAAADAGYDADKGVLRVLKLRYQEVNHPHRDTAGEFRLLSDFARNNGMQIRWIDAVQPAELADRLARGEGDIAVADLDSQLADADGLLPSLSMGTYYYAVYGRRELQVADPSQLSGLRVAVTLSSPLWPYFNALESHLDKFSLVVLPDDTSRAAILAGIAAGDYDAAVVSARANERLASAQPRIRRLFKLSGENAAVWHFAAGGERLRQRIDAYVQRYHAAQSAPPSAFGDLDKIRERQVVRVITRIDPQNYFLKAGRPAGFEYELVRAFSRSEDLAVEFLVAESDSQALAWLRNGMGDLLTTRVNAARVRADPAITQSRNYFYSAAVIVNHVDDEALSLSALAGKRVGVLANSVQHRALSALVARGTNVVPVIFNPDTPLDDVARRIETRELDAAIIDAYAVDGLRTDHPLLQAGASLPSEYRYAWSLRSGDIELHATVNEFLRHFYRKKTYNILARRYIEHPQFARFAAVKQISPYDALVRRHAETFNFDWRLIVAQMYYESKFNPAAQSSAGASGLMQLLPSTARALGIRDPFDPDAAIRGGIAYLNVLREQFDPNISPRERTWFALAAYNTGFQRVQRARQEAAAAGLDSNRWFGNVEQVMRNAANAGSKCNCGETVTYVRRIRSLYNTYSRLQETLTAGLGEKLTSPTI